MKCTCGYEYCSSSSSSYIFNTNMKDYIDVSNQENVAPVYFQSLSLD